MTELKTLKDLEKRFNYVRKKEMGFTEDLLVRELLTEHKLLRQEAIKWIKARIRKCKNCSCLGDWSNLIPCEEHRFWMDRFNITKEELK